MKPQKIEHVSFAQFLDQFEHLFTKDRQTVEIDFLDLTDNEVTFGGSGQMTLVRPSMLHGAVIALIAPEHRIEANVRFNDILTLHPNLYVSF